MTAQVDEVTVRQFLEIINAHAAQVINGAGPPGVLQLCRINPNDEKSIVPSRFQIGDVEHMLATALGDASAGHNVYIEPRTVRADLRGTKRGGLEDTAWVFGFVIDSDADKGKGGHVVAKPTLATETSAGNFHLWYLLMRAISAAQAKPIGDAIRASSGADQDTGVVTQCYRVAGTPNFPSAAKRARGRINVEPTRIVEYTGRLWDPDELIAAFASPVTVGTPPSSRRVIPTKRHSRTTCSTSFAMVPARRGPLKVFHDVVAQLRRRNWTVDAITALLERYPDGIAKKYAKRLRKEVERSYSKVAAGVALPAASTGPAGGGRLCARQALLRHHVIPTIRIVPGRLPEIAAEIARALITKGAPVFARSGTLVEPVSKPPPQPTDARPSPRGCVHYLSNRCCGQLPTPRSSRASTVNAMPGSMSIRHCSSCDGAGRRATMDLSTCERDHHHPDAACRRIAACRSGLRPAIGALPAGDLAIIPYSRATNERASPRCARHADRPPV